MAETPFSPESGAASGGTAPADGELGSADQSPVAGSSEPAPADTHEAAATVEGGSGEPAMVAAPADEPAAPLESSEVAAASPTAAVADEPVAQPPGVAATIAVPPLEGSENGGGEWELLVERFTSWWKSGELNRQWQRIRGPLKGVAILVALLLALQVYATVVSTIDAIPLVSGLLELIGLIAVLQFSATRLLRSSDRQEVFAQLQRRWLDFRGRS